MSVSFRMDALIKCAQWVILLQQLKVLKCAAVR